jgi:hypothetical protein
MDASTTAITSYGASRWVRSALASLQMEIEVVVLKKMISPFGVPSSAQWPPAQRVFRKLLTR